VDYGVYLLSELGCPADWWQQRPLQPGHARSVRMHDNVHDYTGMRGCEWVKRRPAVWSELDRETWMENLIEFLEQRQLTL
jgi:hypothetical protein